MKYCFDIDGTLCTTNCHYKDAKPFTNVIDKVNKLYEDGHEITLFTSRGSGSGTDWFEFTKKQVDNLTKINSLSLFHPFPKLNQKLIDRNDGLIERKLDPKKKYLLHFGIIRKYKG